MREPGLGLRFTAREREKTEQNHHGSFVFTSVVGKMYKYFLIKKTLNNFNEEATYDSPFGRKSVKLHKVMTIMEAFMCVKNKV